MTPVLNDIISAMNRMQSEIYKIESASNAAFDASNLKVAQSAISQANVQLRQAEQEMNNFSENTKQAAQEMNKFSENTKQAAQETNNFLGNTKKVAHSSNTLLSTLKKIAVTLGVIKGVKVFVRMSDDMALANSRLNLIKREGESVAEINKKIYESAQRSRGDYMMTADAVSKLGTEAKNAFKNTDEIIAFTEQLNKMFVLSGTSASGIESVMYNLTQAMASGLLRGQDLNAVISNTPLIMEEVAKYMNISIGEIRNMAQEGKLTADVVKNALLSSAEETNNKFKDMNMTFGQIGVMIKNTFVKNLAPALQLFNEMLNTEKFKIFVENIASGVSAIAIVVGEISGLLLGATNFLVENGKIAIVIFTAIGLVALASSTGVLSFGVASATSSAGVLQLSGATNIATGSIITFNKALLMCPLFWIPAVIITIIALIYIVIDQINKVKGTSISATGVILGALNTIFAVSLNLAVGLWNTLIIIGVSIWNHLAALGEFLANVFKHPVTAVKSLFADMANFVLGILKGIASTIDAIFGSNLSEIVSGWAGAVESYRNEIQSKHDDYVTIERVNYDKFLMERKSYSDSYKSAYNFGKNLGSGLSDKLNSDLTGGFSNSSMLDGINGLQGSLDDIKGDTGKIKDSVAWDNNSLTGLKDLMFARSVTGLSKEVRLEVNNSFTGNISSELDLEELTEKANDKLIKRLAIELNGGY